LANSVAALRQAVSVTQKLLSDQHRELSMLLGRQRAEELGGAAALAELMRDLGYQCTKTAAAFRELIAEYGAERVKEPEVARVLGMLARTTSGLNDAHSGLAAGSFLRESSGDAVAGPDDAYLARCGAVAAELHSLLRPSKRSRRAQLRCLAKKYNLRWDEPAVAPPTPQGEARHRTLDEAAKELRTLATRYVASAQPLARGPFAWVRPPRRALGERAVRRELGNWVDRTESASDASLFASTGLWTSPTGRFTFKLLAAAMFPLVVWVTAAGVWTVHPAFADTTIFGDNTWIYAHFT
jgi:hypothetical protein